MDAELRRAVAGSVVVHLILLGTLALTMWERPVEPVSSKSAPPIQARVVDEKTALEPVRHREAEAQRQKALAEKKRREAEAEKQRRADQKRKQAEAEKRKKAELKRKRLEAERKRKEVEQKRLAEEQRKKQEAERLRKEQEDRERRETALKQRLAEEQARLETEARQQRRERFSRQQSQYEADIKNKVGRNWLRPPGSRGNLCRVVINQIPGGEVTGVRVTDCDGDVAFQRSVEAAVRKASPLPLPADPELFQREIEFVFRP